MRGVFLSSGPLFSSFLQKCKLSRSPAGISFLSTGLSAAALTACSGGGASLRPLSGPSKTIDFGGLLKNKITIESNGSILMNLGSQFNLSNIRLTADRGDITANFGEFETRAKVLPPNAKVGEGVLPNRLAPNVRLTALSANIFVDGDAEKREYLGLKRTPSGFVYMLYRNGIKDHVALGRLTQCYTFVLFSGKCVFKASRIGHLGLPEKLEKSLNKSLGPTPVDHFTNRVGYLRAAKRLGSFRLESDRRNKVFLLRYFMGWWILGAGGATEILEYPPSSRTDGGTPYPHDCIYDGILAAGSMIAAVATQAWTPITNFISGNPTFFKAAFSAADVGEVFSLGALLAALGEISLSIGLAISLIALADMVWNVVQACLKS